MKLLLCRTIILYLCVLFAMRLMGKRQVGQLQPFELVVVIMIAELAATPMGGVGIPILYGLLPMAALVVCHGLLTALCMKSEHVRVWLCGQPTVLVRNGVICEKQMRACAVDLNDLMEAIRAGGILDPLEVGTAVLEPGGNISVFPKADSRPLMPSDLGKMPPKEGLPLPLILDGEVQTENLQRGQLSLSWLMGQIRALGTVNVGAVEEYAETKALVDDLTAQQQDLKRAEMDLRELIERLLIQMRSTFVENFSKMQGYFAETFTRLFGGGHAELKLMDPDDPLNCGIEVNAQPPGKKLQLLSLLSGGERALTAIAILFAMLKLKPTPFCILDEIEAALDDANIGYYADYLKEYSKGTQFIVVTHRKGTMERCNSLFGVAMEEQGVSRMVSVSLQDYQE